jgi:hypothetical protein
MSNQNSNTQQTIIKLDSLQLQGQVEVVMSDEIIDKIKFLCKSIPKEEWSGVLFYTVEGSARKAPDGMKCIIQDILLMDHGSSAHTEFFWDEDVVWYQQDHPEAIDWVKGLIHSHNTMTVFFSGEDNSELNDNVGNHNIFLSIIVNNYLDIAGKLVFTAQPLNYQCKDEFGKDYTLKISSGMEPLMLVYDCKFTLPANQLSVSEEFAKRLELVEKKSADRAEEKRKSYSSGHGYHNGNSNNNHDKKDYSKPNPRTPGNYTDRRFEQGELGLEQGDWGFIDKEINKGNNKTNLPLLPASQENRERNLTSIEELFTCYVLRLGNSVQDDNIEDTLGDLEIASLSPESLTNTIIENYFDYFNEFFEKEIGYDGDKGFLTVLEYVIQTLEENENQFQFIIPVVAGLKLYGNKYSLELLKQVQ